jgi:cell division protein FtsB
LAARILESLLFWLMFTAGGACLTACLLLPPWFEYQATYRQWVEAERRAADVERSVRTIRRQIDRLEQDEAYLNRVAFEELGLPTPGVETLAVIPSEPAHEADDELPQRQQERLAIINELVQRYPLAWVFVRPDTRPAAMAASGLMVLAALLLRKPRRAAPAAEDEGA